MRVAASDISIRYERARIQHTGPTLASDDEDSGGDDEFDEVDPAAAGAISPQKKRRTARDDKRKKLLAAQLGALAETLDAPYLPPLPVKHSYMQTPVCCELLVAGVDAHRFLYCRSTPSLRSLLLFLPRLRKHSRRRPPPLSSISRHWARASTTRNSLHPRCGT